MAIIKSYGFNAIERNLVSKKASRPSFPPSRPIPLSFNPPNGASAVDGAPSFQPTTPYSNSSAIFVPLDRDSVKKYAASPKFVEKKNLVRI